MKNVTHNELRQLWRQFYEKKGHAFIGSASLIPENDPTVLFTTAGMHPLVPYLLGEKHPAGKRLCNVQKCVRTGDIDDVGDASHCTFFEMLGNWSLGDYFKKEKIAWSYEFLTSPDYLGIDTKNLAVTVFAGDDDCPRDTESAQLWQDCGIDKSRIFYLPKACNWWGPAGMTGPCGPDTEMFMAANRPDCKVGCGPDCRCGKYLEIGNDVFMQYNKTAEGTFEPLTQKNVDTGMGLERMLCVLGGLKSVYETDVFLPIIRKIEALCGKTYGENEETTRAIRIIADHIRTSVHMIGDERGVVCSNVGQGYILRRLLRRAIRFGNKLEIPSGGLCEIARAVINVYKNVYPELAQGDGKIMAEIEAEHERFGRTIAAGLKEFEKLARYQVGDTISGKACFRLYDTHGFPVEMTEELAREYGFKIDKAGFDTAFVEHQQKSREGAEGDFKGGLADNTAQTTRLHTATHLMHAALKKVLNDENVNQKGSNITEERLRFDFTFGRPMTDDEIAEVEKLVNKAIEANIPVTCDETDVETAQKNGAIGLFTQKYGEKVKVYTIAGYSKEICGGPHAASTGELGQFKILKESSSSAGVRRIKAVLVHSTQHTAHSGG
ncbi:MAG: alanine--tRNA ligase [Firmicutes bacterium]|nr:alanine--tRNA ligase [Bacillota bacterium]